MLERKRFRYAGQGQKSPPLMMLSFLKLMNDLNPDVLDDEKKAILTKFIVDRNITRKDITTYAPVFPNKALRTLLESDLIYNITL